MENKKICVCKRCIMDDSSDLTISFDEQGFCNYCTEAYERKKTVYFPNEEGKKKLEAIIEEIKNCNKDKKYDCIMGVSGGLDSSYLAYIAWKYGLRALAIHIDDGYDTEISKENVRKLIQKTGFDYQVITPDAKQFNALTLAFMKAGVPNLAMPQDDILFAFLYGQMKENKIKYFLSGENFALESILQRGNSHRYTDVVNIKDINKRFGTDKLDKLKFLSTKEKIMDKYIGGIKTVRLLDYVDYNRDRAFAELKDFCGFEYYGRKHLENILTGFIQLYWFPKKFNFDKRKSHLSSMIVSDQMTRDEALKELAEPLYDEKQMDEWMNYIAKQLGITRKEFDEICAQPTHQHEDYKVEDDSMEYKAMQLAMKVKAQL